MDLIKFLFQLRIQFQAIWPRAPRCPITKGFIEVEHAVMITLMKMAEKWSFLFILLISKTPKVSCHTDRMQKDVLVYNLHSVDTFPLMA